MHIRFFWTYTMIASHSPVRAHIPNDVNDARLCSARREQSGSDVHSKSIVSKLETWRSRIGLPETGRNIIPIPQFN